MPPGKFSNTCILFASPRVKSSKKFVGSSGPGDLDLNERGPIMLTVTTIYFANLEPIRDPLMHEVIKNEISDLESAERNVVVVYAGSSRVPTKRQQD